MRSIRSWSAFVVLCLTLVASQLGAATTHVNAKIAFNSNRDGNDEIYVMNADGTGQTRLTNNAASDFEPAWSPDGTKIAFNRGFDIFVMNADGSEPTRLTFAAAMNIAPSWSPDGTKIAFHSSRDGNFEIYVMNADGSNQTRLTSNAAGDFAPAWSPDGQRIVFRSNRDGNNEIYVMAKDGTAQTRVTVNTADDQEPKFSGDGTKIVFTRALPTRQITVINTDGTNTVQLTSAGNNFFPTMSPDGKEISFVSDRDGNHEIYTMNFNGSSQDRLTNNFIVDDYPAWQSGFLISTVGVYRPTTGQWLLRTSHTSGNPNLTFTFGGQPGDQPVAGDWNGDGRTDLGIFRNGTFLRGVITVTTACPRCFAVTTIDQLDPLPFGQASDRPIAGDWNGDGIDDVGVYRPNTSTFILRVPETSTSVPCHGCPPVTETRITTFTSQFGSVGDLPVTGDWDGDGKDSIGVFHNGVFNLTNDFFETNGSSVFGVIGDLPLSGDWTGVGSRRLGLFHPSTATMTLETKLGEGPDINFTFGSASDLPVAGHWTAVAP
jgi:dipeptidyl aminopeptidase/acylaminoacyl peptidase